MTRVILGGAVVVAAGLGGVLYTSRAPEPAPTPPPAPGQQVGVHGAWSIEVRESDGTLVERQAFANDYVDDGHGAATLFAGQASVGYLGIFVSGGTHPCQGSGGTPSPCRILPPGALHSYDAATVSDNLVATVDGNSVTYTGSFVVGSDGNLGSVITIVQLCDPSVATADCGISLAPTVSSVPFTTHALDSLIEVREGQQVLVDFELQFTPAP